MEDALAQKYGWDKRFNLQQNVNLAIGLSFLVSALNSVIHFAPSQHLLSFS